MTEADVRKLLGAKIGRVGGLRAFCREHELDPSYVGKVVAGQKLSPAILTALGLEIASTHTTYRKIRSKP